MSRGPSSSNSLDAAPSIVTGLERLLTEAHLLDGCGRIGLVSNQAVSTSQFLPAPEVVHQACSKAKEAKLTCVFGPQHGYAVRVT